RRRDAWPRSYDPGPTTRSPTARAGRARSLLQVCEHRCQSVTGPVPELLAPGVVQNQSVGASDPLEVADLGGHDRFDIGAVAAPVRHHPGDAVLAPGEHRDDAVVAGLAAFLLHQGIVVDHQALPRLAGLRLLMGHGPLDP